MHALDLLKWQLIYVSFNNVNYDFKTLRVLTDPSSA